MNNKADIIKKEGLVAILRGFDTETSIKTASALYKGGVRIIESAYDSGDKMTIKKNSDIIKEIRKNLPDDLIIGAGTTLNSDQVYAAYEAGADFIFSPNTNKAVIEETKKLEMVSIPGALTPTEIMSAYDMGADIIKLFPVTPNEISYIVNIMRPLSHISFICVGGTNENTIERFFKAGAIGVGTGLSILKPEWIKENNYNEIERMAKLHIDIVRRCQLEAGINFL